METKTILVTGANGQLGNEMRQLASQFPSYNFLFVTKEDLPIDDFGNVQAYFQKHPVNYCINCAAYTAVDKAETEKEKAFLINGDAVGNLAAMCKQFGARLIHVSTDYVFNGLSKEPYKEDEKVDPVNTYGASKLRGEEMVLDKDPGSIIIRTSWVFSSFGNNFVKTMLRVMSQRESINVVNDQEGCPTYAADLAKAIMRIVEKDKDVKGGIYNYCNEGITTWYDFAVAIKELSGSGCVVNSIPTSEFPTPAKRPKYSVLETSKIKDILQISIPNWKDALKDCLAQLKNQ
jgi:dTDP-4-dehydrorhamnose reductase